MIPFLIVGGVVVAVITGDPNAILAGIGLAGAAFALQVLGEILSWLGVK